MHNLVVQIVRFIDSGFPGWVECELVDAAGRLHCFKDKVPIFTVDDLHADSRYPTPGLVACEVMKRYQTEKGEELVLVSTINPFGIESTEGLSEFTVSSTAVTSNRDNAVTEVEGKSDG